MNKIFRKIKEGLIRVLELAVIVITGVLVLDVLWQVFTRFILKNPSTWTEELATILLMWMALLGASVTFSRKGHLGVDYFVNKLGVRYRNVTELIVYLVVSFFAVTMIYGGYRIVAFTLLTNQLSAALQSPMGYVYLSIPISGFFILVISLETLIEKINFLFNSDKE